MSWNSTLSEVSQVFSTGYAWVVHQLDVHCSEFLTSCERRSPSPEPKTRRTHYISMNDLEELSSRSYLSSFISQGFLDDSLVALQDCRAANSHLRSQLAQLSVILEAHDRIVEAIQTLVNKLSKLPKMPFPPLPLDIVEQMVDAAAASSTTTALILTYVSKDFQSWSDKQLFRHLKLWEGPEHRHKSHCLPMLLSGHKGKGHGPDSDRICRAFSQTRALYLGRSESHSTNSPFCDSLLRKCSRLERLSFNLYGKVIVQPSSIPTSIRRLACSLSQFAVSSPESLGHPIFNQITHLQITKFSWSQRADLSKLRNIPSLTHLYMDSTSVNMRILQLQQILQPSLPPQLRVMLICVASSMATDPHFTFMSLGEFDSRVVLCMYATGINLQAQGLADVVALHGWDGGEYMFLDGDKWLLDPSDELWELALEVVERRRRPL